jgi:hypothetical protein
MIKVLVQLSLHHKRIWNDIFLAPYLSKDGNLHFIYHHRIVWEWFMGDFENKERMG